MSIDLDRYYDQSIPPSLIPPPPIPATGATAGIPGTWTPAGSQPPATVDDLIAGIPNPVIPSPATAWTMNQYVQTRTPSEAGQAYWTGTAWVNGIAAFTPLGQTIAAVQAYIEALGDQADPDVIAETQRVLDIERATGARSTLIAWLDARLGAV